MPASWPQVLPMKRVAISAVVLGFLLASCGHSNCDTCHGEESSPIIAAFGATPTKLPAGGGNVAVTWTVYGATSLSLSDGHGRVTQIPVATTSIVQDVTVTSTLTLSATNTIGTSTVSVAITVQ